MNSRTGRTGRLSPRRRAARWPKALGLLAVLGMGAGAVAAWTWYADLGRTPTELLDHTEERLIGHGALQRAARPVLDLLREGLDAPRPAERARNFVVPPPPPRRGVEAVPAPEPVPTGAKVWRVGPGEALTRIADAARRARDGDVVEIVAGDYRGDVAVWSQKRLTIRGVGGAARLWADGRHAEGKGIWVIRGGDFDISNIDFIGARVGDGNGAGIRFEGGTLRVRHCLFWDNQMGLLTAGAPKAADATVQIESSEFAYSHVPGRWGHNLYVGSIASLAVTASYFHHAGVGHLLKSRARVNDIRYNRFTDERGGQASYELDFPNGGEVRLVGNTVQQQQGTENGRLIAFGEEGYAWPRNTLQMASNTFVNDHPHGGSFVYVAPGAGLVVSANNLRVGRGRDQITDEVLVLNDHRAEPADFQDPAGYGYGLRDPAPGWRYQPLTGPAAAQLTPQARYRHPLRVERLAGPPQFAGAEPNP
ncbi:hypothetical protein [Pseudorhodoferax sp.]|uniref:hypothetical protein n=1 Tax=Pseudorhodoferax sp. TaxID=1993553 RepID=UPI002DD633AC|nr:hypothetical protein [Pseudorhodoferax sp.]